MKKFLCFLFGHDFVRTDWRPYFDVKMKAFGKPPEYYFKCKRCSSLEVRPLR
jgi:hypothetical protein